VLAELARTDSHRFRVLVPDSDRTKALRSMTRARERSSVDSQIALAFLRRYPTPLDARGLTRKPTAHAKAGSVSAALPARCSATGIRAAR
jgi:hypothetical protein